ncbi:TRAP transporter small permease subunit [Glaciecola sp. 1036]|uniref:TRAP transporter small permease subunit n=1 Tax=Alteromonadaceae TaxID=72275 RepID=UPI003D058AAA
MLLKISAFIDSINSLMGRFISYATIVMALLMFIIVVLRYGFNLGWIALQESVTYLHAAVFLLGAAYTYQQDGHVRVDIFYRRFTNRKKTWVNLLGSLCFMLPVSLYIAIVCIDYVAESWSLLEGSMEPGGLPLVFLLKTFIFLFSLSLVIQAVSEIIKHTLSLLNTPSVIKETP